MCMWKVGQDLFSFGSSKALNQFKQLLKPLQNFEPSQKGGWGQQVVEHAYTFCAASVAHLSISKCA